MAGIAPDPKVPETSNHSYERIMAPTRPGVRGPLRFEEGLATDPSVPRDFERGAMEGIGAAGRSSDVDRETQFKHAAETMQERLHPGSAAWTDSPTFRGEFASEADGDWSSPSYVQVDRSGGRYERTNVAKIV